MYVHEIIFCPGMRNLNKDINSFKYRQRKWLVMAPSCVDN